MDLGSKDTTPETYVPSSSSPSYSSKEVNVLVTAEGPFRRTCATLCPEEIDGAQEPTVEKYLDLDPNRDSEHLLVPPIPFDDEIIVVDEILCPFLFPIPLRPNLLDII